MGFPQLIGIHFVWEIECEASMRPGKSRVIVTVSEVTCEKVTAAGGIEGGAEATFFPQAGNNSQMRDRGRKWIGRMIRKRQGRQMIVRREELSPGYWFSE